MSTFSIRPHDTDRHHQQHQQLTHEQLNEYLGLAYSRRLGTKLVERQRDGSIRIKDHHGAVLLTFRPHEHSYALHGTYRDRSTGQAGRYRLCTCGATTATVAAA